MQKNFDSNLKLAQKLNKEGVILSSVNHLIKDEVLTSSDWKEFAATWRNLPTDQYMNDGGTYRERRFSRFHLDLNGQNLRQKEHAPYSQPKHLNPLNGGMLRHFDPMHPQTVGMSIFRKLLITIGELLGQPGDKPEWDINVYQNRTLASKTVNGKPVPEGIHRDGVRYSVLLGIGRHNVIGAVSTVFNDDKQPLYTHTVSEGDLLIFCDEVTYHDTTAVALADDSLESGTRDIMVIEFYSALNNENQYYVK